MGEADFVYVTYIAASPSRVWTGLSDPDWTRQCFGMQMESAWTSGAPFRFVKPDGRVESEGVMLEIVPRHRASLAWRSGMRGGAYGTLPEAVVTYRLEQMGDVVRLTVSETHAPPVDASYLAGARTGWPLVLSRLKTLLETGHPLPQLKPAS
jgi:uncharacterized protein YndB with AHSA1/START domain